MNDIRKDQYGNDADVLSARLAAANRIAPKSPTEALQPETVPPPPKRSRAARHPLVVFFNFVLTLVIIGAVIVGGGLIFGRMQFDNPGSLQQATTITIDRGVGVRDIADRLQRDGVISSKWLFVAGVWLNREGNNLKAGEYAIPAHASMREVMDLLVDGKSVVYRITIPEGLTSQQVVACLTADGVPAGEDIPGLTNDQEVRCRESAAALVGPAPPVPPEGSVLPDTYAFSRGDSRANILNLMMRERDRVLTDVWARRAPDLPITTIDELATLASIVEKETSLADERTRVASVFINRLRLNMRLQSDPTFIYGIYGGAGKPDGYVATAKDRDTPTPYNTYTIDGLPPGPIANPGRASLEAVANPSRTRDLFFVADGSGGHAFAETYEEHLRNVARWREIKASGGATGAEVSTTGEEPMALQDPDQ
ncbi:MAG: endolytic transglycosylase MltG [Rhizobiales bacterium]|nr:endolytic transglycosylase MltG [Hyphomicrobiales bacterium]